MKKSLFLLIAVSLLSGTTALYAQDAAEETISEFIGGDSKSPLSYTFDFTNLVMNDNFEYSFKKIFMSVSNSKDKSWGYYDLKASKGKKVKIDGKDYFIVDAVAVVSTGKEMQHPDFRKKIRFGFPDYWLNITDEILILDENNKTLFTALLMSED